MLLTFSSHHQLIVCTIRKRRTMLTVLTVDHKHYFADCYPKSDLKLWLEDIPCPCCGSRKDWRYCGFSPRYLMMEVADIRLVYLQRVYCRSCCRLSSSGSRRVPSTTHLVLPFDVVAGQCLTIDVQKAVHDQICEGRSQEQVASSFGVSRFMVKAILSRFRYILYRLSLMLAESDPEEDSQASFLDLVRRGFKRYGSLLFSVHVGMVPGT